MNALNGQDLQGARLEISLAKVFNIICTYYSEFWLTDLQKSAATLWQEEEGGNVEETGAEDDAGYGWKVGYPSIIVRQSFCENVQSTVYNGVCINCRPAMHKSEFWTDSLVVV